MLYASKLCTLHIRIIVKFLDFLKIQKFIQSLRLHTREWGTHRNIFWLKHLKFFEEFSNKSTIKNES